MEFARGLRYMGAIWAIAILAFWSLNPLGNLVQEIFLNPKISSPALPLSHKIEAPGHEIKICHHHPEGCPKECFCPKMTVAEENPGDIPSRGTLAEPALTQCTEGFFKADLWASVLLFPFSTWEYFSFELSSRLRPAAVHSLISRYPDPLQKVPIA